MGGCVGWVVSQVKLYSNSFGLPLGFPFGPSVTIIIPDISVCPLSVEKAVGCINTDAEAAIVLVTL